MAKNEESMAAAAKNKESSMGAASWILPLAGATVVMAGATVAVLAGATRRYRRRKWCLNYLRNVSARKKGLIYTRFEDLGDISNFSLFFKKDPFGLVPDPKMEVKIPDPRMKKMKLIKMDPQMQMKIVESGYRGYPK